MEESKTSAKVASCGYDGLRRGRAVVIPGVMNHLLVQSLRVTPRSVVRKISRYISDRG